MQDGPSATDEAALIDSFFLPGGILDPDGEDNLNNNDTDDDANDVTINSDIDARSPYSSPAKQQESSFGSPGSRGSHLINISGAESDIPVRPCLWSVRSNPWDDDGNVLQQRKKDEPGILNSVQENTNNGSGTGVPDVDVLLVDGMTIPLLSLSSSALDQPYFTTPSLEPISVPQPQQSSSHGGQQQDAELLTVLGGGGEKSPSQKPAAAIATSMEAARPAGLTIPPPGFDSSSTVAVASSTSPLGKISTKSHPSPLSLPSAAPSVGRVSPIPPMTPPHFSSGSAGGEGGSSSTSSPWRRKSYATVVAEAKMASASGAKSSPAHSATPNADAANVKRVSVTNAASSAPAGSPRSPTSHRPHHQYHHSGSDDKTFKQSQSPSKSPACPARSNSDSSPSSGNSMTKSHNDRSYVKRHNSKAGHEEEERSAHGSTHRQTHAEDERHGKERITSSSSRPTTSSSLARGRSSGDSATLSTRQNQNEFLVADETNSAKSQQAESETTRHTDVGSGAPGSSSLASQQQRQRQPPPFSFLEITTNTCRAILSIAIGIFRSIVPMIGHLFLAIGFLFAAAAKLLILLALGLANTSKYACEEIEQIDGAFLCYLVLYLVPRLCDLVMVYFSMPHYTPHLISAIAMYQLCRVTPSSASMSTSLSSSSRRKYKTRQQSLYADNTRAKDLCTLVLRSFRSLIPFELILEGFTTSPNLSVMMLHDWTRLLLAFVLSLIRANLILSPVAWLSWSIQVFIIVYLPPNFISGCFLLMLGLASVRLSTVIQQTDVFAGVSASHSNGKHHKVQ